VTSTDVAAIAAARRLRPPRANLDEDTDFVIRVLDWILSERSAGRLMSGSPLTLVQFDFTPPRASNLGALIDLHNNGATLGAIHICAESLRRAHVLPGATGLITLTAHQAAIAQRQLSNRTAISFDPPSGTLQVRFACLPHVAAIDMQLGGQLALHWKGQGLTPLPAAIGAFHTGLTRATGVGSLLFENDRVSSRVRVYYRNAMLFYLKYQLGLRESEGYRVTARKSDVAVTHLETGSTSLVTAAATRSEEQTVSTAMIKRLVDEAAAAHDLNGADTFISCVDCPSTHPPSEECAWSPVSLRHRHVRAA
jgi:hypothetical protein